MVHRAWIELKRDHLAHNIQTINEHLPSSTELMAVLKGNAYGHGSRDMAKELQKLDVKRIAVATLEEAIDIRKANFDGDILIFSYTPIEEAQQLLNWNLIQNVIDFPYAAELNERGGPFRVHIEVDTGMNRLGERHTDFQKISAIFQMKNLKVEGIYSHFSRSDTLDPADIDFTNKQVHRFNEVLEKLKASGIRLPKAHLQSSYGMLNYPLLQYDYARIGTLICGMRSHCNPTLVQLPLKPVLSIKTKIILIKHVPAGDTIGYGKTNIADEDKKIAVLPIGFVDGIPEQLSTSNGEALVRGQRVPVIGSVSMNHMMVDVTKVKNVQTSDVVTLIGKDQNEMIPIEEVAVKIGSVSHNVLSSLSPSLKRIWV